MTDDRRLATSRTLIAALYEGPWERAETWLSAIDWRTGEIWREVPDGSLRDRLANFCDRRNTAWRDKWARRQDDPPPRWKRRTA